MWGLPVSPSWLAANPADSVQIQVLADAKSPACWKPLFASCVANCLREIEQWQEHGVQVASRSWLDLGCGFGHYAVALKLLGASRVVALDASDPLAWSWSGPVLTSLDVEVSVSMAEEYSAPGIHSACVLGWSLDLQLFLGNNTELACLVLETDLYPLGSSLGRRWETDTFSLRDASYVDTSGGVMGQGEPVQVTVASRSIPGKSDRARP